jgi:hypothetical protein
LERRPSASPDVRWRLAWLAGAAVTLSAGLAAAQPGESGAIAVLYDQPNFHGQAVRVVGGAADLRRFGFARRALSGHFDGDWMVCDGLRFTGRCVTVTGALTDLTPLGLDRRIASLRQGEAVSGDARDAGGDADEADDGYFDRGGAASDETYRTGAAADRSPRGQGEGALERGVAGYATVFFIRPQRGGADVPGEARADADAFCRGQGLGAAIYYDTDGHILRDVLCRRD